MSYLYLVWKQPRLGRPSLPHRLESELEYINF